MAIITKRVCMAPWLFYERIFTYHVNPPCNVTSIQHGYHNITYVYGTLIKLWTGFYLSCKPTVRCHQYPAWLP